MDTVIILLLVLMMLIFSGFCFCKANEQFANQQELRKKIAKSAENLKPNKKLLKNSHNPNVQSFISKEIYFEIEPNEQVYQRAEEFHRAFNQNKIERITELKRLYSELGKPTTLIITMFCKDYFKYFKNWVLSCEKANIKIRDKTITFSLDKDAKRMAENLGFKSYLIDDKYMKAGGAKVFGDQNFSSTMFYKNGLIYDMLTIIPENKFLLFQDSDLIWFKNPLEYLESQSKNSGEDMLIMYDGPNYHYKNIYANSGFIFLKSNDVTRSVFETALKNSALIFGTGSHQKPLEKIFEHYLLHNMFDMKVLSETKFLNGHLFRLDGSLDNKVPKDWKNSSFVFHYSWAMNEKEKFKKLNNLGLNYIGINK